MAAQGCLNDLNGSAQRACLATEILATGSFCWLFVPSTLWSEFAFRYVDVTSGVAEH